MGKGGKMVNETHDAGEGEVLGATLAAYEEFDMNKLNSTVGSHANLSPKSSKGNK